MDELTVELVIKHENDLISCRESSPAEIKVAEFMRDCMVELKEYRNNPMATMKPCTKYVKINSLEDQLHHIETEIKETHTARGWKDKMLESYDVAQAGITLLGILEYKYGVNIAELIAEGQEKNAKRNYYD